MQSTNYSYRQTERKQFTNSPSSIIVDEKTIKNRTSIILRKLSILLEKLHSDSLVLNYGTRLTPAKPADLIRVLASSLDEDSLNHTLRNIIISAILSAEKMQVGAGIVCAYLLTQRHMPHNTAKPNKRSQLETRIESVDIDSTLRYFLGRGLLYDLMKTVIEAGGMSASLEFGLANGEDFIVRAHTTKEVLGEVHPLFTAHGETKNFKNVAVIAMDGAIESIGAVDHLLQELAEEKCLALLCARSFAPDVVATLNQNWRAGNLQVVPFVVRAWEVLSHKTHDAESSAVEICKKLNITCVSPSLGETMKTVTLDDFRMHDQAVLSRQGLSFQSIEGTSQFIEVKLPKRMANMLGVISDRCQLSQKACIGMARSGKCTKTLSVSTADKNRNFNIYVSHAAESTGAKAAISCYNIMNNLGAIVAYQS